MIYFSFRYENISRVLGKKTRFQIRKMTRAASQAGDADSFRTPGLNSSVQTSMNDRGVPYYWRQNESAWLIRYLILAVKSCQDSLNLNKREDDTSNMSWNLKYSAWIAKRVTTDTFLHAHMNYIYINYQEVGIISTFKISLSNFSMRNFFTYYPFSNPALATCNRIIFHNVHFQLIGPHSGIQTYDLRVVPFT